MKTKIILTILIAFFFLSPVQAQESTTTQENATTQEESSEIITTPNITAADIANACKNYFDHTFNTRENISRKAICNGYFFGIGSTILTLRSSGKLSGMCIPEDISTHQVIKAFLHWARQKESDLKTPATEAVIKSLDQMYPCG